MHHIVFIDVDHYNSLGIVRMLGEAKLNPVVVSTSKKFKMTTRSRYCKKAYYVDTLDEGLELIKKNFSSDREKSFIHTFTDTVVLYLNQHYDELKDYFYFNNAGNSKRMDLLLSKEWQINLAKKCGFNIIPTWKVKVGEIPEDITYPLITKSSKSACKNWKKYSVICQDEGELKEFYSKLESEDVPDLLLQKYIEKSDELSYEGFSINRGKDVMYVYKNIEQYHQENGYCPVLISTDMDDEEYIKKSNKYIKESRFEGIFDFEFIVDKDGTRYFLETNWRNDTLGYLSAIVNMPLPVLWERATIQGYIDSNMYKPLERAYISTAECYDYDVRVKGGLITKRQWWKEYRKADCHLYRGRGDFIPFFIFMWTKLLNRNKVLSKKL